MPLDVNGLITEMTGMLGRLIGEDIEVTLALAPGLSLALADRGQLEQVVMNLVVNARDAMPGGGSVTIETADVELENSSFHEEAIVQGHYVMLAITDTGSGMTKETQRHLFEPFFTTKETGHGTGLGLSTTYGIVKQSKGYIWVYSEPGLGTTFKVYWPRSSRDVPLPVPSSGGHRTRSRPRRRRCCSSRTRPACASSRSASSARPAIECWKRPTETTPRAYSHDHAGSIDLVVTDVIMPGCGGPELLSRLQVQAPALRVLYMSGYTDQSVVRKAGLDRGLPFVQKPFTAAELVRQVRQTLDT